MQWSGAKAEVVLKAKRLIDHAFAEKFDLCAISDKLFVNRSYLCRVFKKETGMTLLEYCNKKRCEYVKGLSTQSELPFRLSPSITQPQSRSSRWMRP
ncbi:AraC family transcriptional regulator [Oscillibacter sp.]|uniref:AraC family transcriptional regulator n=1 Tax=Oscillibacter sp. TaxID=1945593 RepID=UPI0037C52E44